jgi:hypothetical protein
MALRRSPKLLKKVSHLRRPLLHRHLWPLLSRLLRRMIILRNLVAQKKTISLPISPTKTAPISV